jgi:geranylgeranyl reductase family protein
MIEVHKDHNISSLVSRAVFDNFLLKKAKETGIEVHTGEKVLSCTEKPEFVEVITKEQTYQAKFAIIAEGAHGLLKTCVRPADTRDEYGISVVAEIPAEEREIEERLGKTVELQLGIANSGYGWIFPHKTYYSVGIFGAVKDYPNPKATMVKFLRNNGFTDDYKLYGHKIPTGGVKRRITGSRVLLTGDAAGFVDAFSGEGLAYAISSGQIAANVLAEISQQRGKLKDLHKYESICRAEFGSHLKYSLIFSRLIYRFPERSFKTFINDREILGKYLEVVDFTIGYKDYLRWALLNFKLR